jgi:predicted porin
MKKMKLLLPALAVTFSVPVFAQNTVTLYGVIDEGFDYTNNALGHKAYDLQSGYVQGSRWGLKGTEDLGGGLKAVFQLENGFNLSNGKLGQSTREFGRQAYVGLASDKLGTVTLGRQYDSLVDYLAQTTANGNWAGYMFSHPYDADNTDNSFRVNNTVKYTSPTFAGFQFGGTYSFSNSTSFANNRQYSLGAQYANGGLLVAAAYLQANNAGSTNTGGAIVGDTNFSAEVMRVFGAGVNYTFGPATLGLSYTNSYFSQPTASGNLDGSIVPTTGTLSNLRFQNFELNGKYQLTPALFLGAMYDYTRANFNATTGKLTPTYHTVGLMADYNLSKRTDVYIQGAYQHVAGDKTGTALDQANVLGANDVSSNRNQIVTRVALRHKF